MKVIGFCERNFTSKDSGELIEGMYIYVTFENIRTTGLSCDRLYVSRKRLNECGYSPSLGDDIAPTYNRYGKITGICLI